MAFEAQLQALRQHLFQRRARLLDCAPIARVAACDGAHALRHNVVVDVQDWHLAARNRARAMSYKGVVLHLWAWARPEAGFIY